MENLNLQSLKYLAGVKDTIAECGMGSNTPASINITAGSGQELTGMLKDIMNLAGVHKVEPYHMPVDTPDAGPSTIVSAPKAPGAMMPDMHKLMAIVDGPEMVKDSMNPEETEEGMIGAGLGGMAGGAVGKTAGAALGSLVGGPVGGAVGGVAGDIAGTALGAKVGDDLTDDEDEETKEEYDNSPDTQIRQDPLGQYGDINSGDHRERQKGLPVARPMEETVNALFAEYEKFISESKVSKKVSEGKVKELDADLKDKSMSDEAFKAKYKMTRAEARANLKSKKVKEGSHTQHYTDLNPEKKKPGIGSKIAGVAKKVIDKIAPGDDELLTRLEKETGGKRPNRYNAESKKPSAGMTKKEKSAVVKKAVAGKDIGKAGKGFAKVEKAAAKGGAKDPKAVAAAAMWKAQAKK